MTDTKKYMTFGEGGTAFALGALAVLSLVVGAKAYTPEYGFHAYLVRDRQRGCGFRDRQSIFRSPVRT